jgi:DNA-binding MarR family transcriptional regulator
MPGGMTRRSSPPAPDPAPGGNPGIDPARFQAWRHFVEGHGAVVRLLADDLDRACRLPIEWYQVLLLLNEAPDRRLVLQDLTELVTLSQSGVSRLVDRMGNDGLVRRVRSEIDRRSYFVELTESGLTELASAAPIHRDGIAKWFTDDLTDQEARVLARVLERVHAQATTEWKARQLDASIRRRPA